MSRRTKERDPATSEGRAESPASSVRPPETRETRKLGRVPLTLLIPLVLVLAIAAAVLAGPAGPVPIAVTFFLLALFYQAVLWAAVRFAFHRALAAPGGRLGPVIRALENLRRYVADEDPLPAHDP